MYAIVNSLDTTAVRAIIKTTLLTAIIVIVFVLTYYAVTTITPLIIGAITAALAIIAHAVSIVAAAIIHAALFALAMLVRAAVLVALCRLMPVVVPVLWRALVALWVHRAGITLAAKGLCFAAVVVACFLGAIVVMPLVLAFAGKALVATAVVGGAILSGKVM
jgi:hypothetical protein